MEPGKSHPLSAAAPGASPTGLRHLAARLFLLAILFSIYPFFADIPPPAGLLFAALLGGYMALNIGANDAGNNIGPLVGSRVMGLAGAMLFAALFEAAGALLAGDEVISTIRQGIIVPTQIGDDAIVRVMLAALLAAALWLNFATLIGTPVSTTHTIIGGVLGAGISLGGAAAANWQMIGAITLGWLVSPLLGGLIAATLLYLIKRSLMYQKQMSRAAGRVVPLLLGFMAWSFTSYLLLKGVKASWRFDSATALLSGLSIGLGVYLVAKPIIEQRTALLPNTQSAVKRLFNLPLLLGAGLLSFAHGSNDVANAIGPLIAILEVMPVDPLLPRESLSLWLLLIGALGIPMGLLMFGHRLIRTIGSEITELDQLRGFCIVTSVTITVLLASQLGLPVSSTHIAVGAIFGIGFLREILKTNYAIQLERVRRHHSGQDQEVIEAYLERFEQAAIGEKGRLLAQLENAGEELRLNHKERTSLQRVYRRELVKRSALLRILAAWFITLPATGTLASMIYWLLS